MYAANNKGADQTAWMHRLICTFVVHILHKQVFSRWFCHVLARIFFMTKLAIFVSLARACFCCHWPGLVSIMSLARACFCCVTSQGLFLSCHWLGLVSIMSLARACFCRVTGWGLFLSCHWPGLVSVVSLARACFCRVTGQGLFLS